MFPDSGFAVPVSSFERPVPLVFVDPDKDASVTVCFNAAWQPYIIGALQQLLLQTTWNVAPGPELDLVQQRAMSLIGLFGKDGGNCVSQTPESEYEMAICEQLRFQDGKLQGLCCGVWTDIPGFQGAAGQAAGQPPPGGTVALGDCREYDVVLQGNGMWRLPVAVQGGDTIEITNAQGGWQDGTADAWRCPSGEEYILGGCIAPTYTPGGDPVPGSPHMLLIAKHGGTFVPAFNTTIAIPDGTPEENVDFQANDTALGDNSGSVTFHIKYCRAGTATWCAEFNASNGWSGWTPITSYGCNATLVSGVWNSCLNSFPFQALLIETTVVLPTGSTITGLTLRGNATDTNPASNALDISDDNGGTYTKHLAGPGTPLVIDYTSVFIRGTVHVVAEMNGPSASPTQILSVQLRGQGPTPSWATALACP